MFEVAQQPHPEFRLDLAEAAGLPVDPLLGDDLADDRVGRLAVEIDRTPQRRWGEPDELRGPVVFLASNASSFVNGHVLVVDGGITSTLF